MKTNEFNASIFKKLSIIAALYLSEGIPYGFIFTTLLVYFRTYGIELKDIGLISLIGLPWSFKALWAPLIDRFGQRWHWIFFAQLILASNIIYLIIKEPNSLSFSIWINLIIFAFAGATQDIAIDAYTIDILEPKEQGIANGVRVAFYRVAVIISGGGLVALSGILNWKGSFYLLIGFILILASLVYFNKNFHISKEFIPPKNKKIINIILSWYLPLKELFLRKNSVIVILFIMFFKFGDNLMQPMIYPFWVDNHFSREEIGFISGVIGVGLTILGSLVGGYLTSLWEIVKALWILGAFQAISNLFYAAAAYYKAERIYVYSASFFESFTSGLGTAAFLAFLMRYCKKRYSATQYAFLSSFFIIGARLAGALSGYAAQHFGYSKFFALTFLASLPAFCLLPFINSAYGKEDK